MDNTNNINLINTEIFDDTAGFDSYDMGDGNFHEGKVPLYYEYAKYVKITYFMKVLDGETLIYDDGKYRTITNKFLDRMLLRLTKGWVNPKHINHFLRMIEGHCYVMNLDKLLDSTAGHINLKNGVLNVSDRELSSHSPQMFFTYKLPWEYDKSCGQPSRWIEYLLDRLDGKQETVDALAEVFGYCMLGGNPWLHKAIIFYGDGRNGKSTVLEILSAMLGKENVSSVPIDKLNKPFSAIALKGKMANITGENKNKPIDPEIFKTAVGGEHITASYKFKDEFPLRIQCRFIFACNELPQFQDATPGLTERLYFIPFRKYISDRDRNPFIAKELMKEMPQIINWALDGADRLISRGRLPDTKDHAEMFLQYRKESDSVFDWAENYVTLDNGIDPNYWLSVKYLYEDYKNKTINNGIHSVSVIKFGKRFANWIRYKNQNNMSFQMHEMYKRRASGAGYNHVTLSDNFLTQ